MEMVVAGAHRHAMKLVGATVDRSKCGARHPAGSSRRECVRIRATTMMRSVTPCKSMASPHPSEAGVKRPRLPKGKLA